jgi:hypothetical protein
MVVLRGFVPGSPPLPLDVLSVLNLCTLRPSSTAVIVLYH